MTTPPAGSADRTQVRTTWRTGIPFIVFCLVLGSMVGQSIENPWWILPALIWLGIGIVVWRWVRRTGHLR
jgi:hypothetical protein